MWQGAVYAKYSLSKNESDGPDADDDHDPCTPSDHTVTVCVSGFTEDSLVDEFTGNVGVKTTNDDGRDEDKGESGFTHPWFLERADGWSGSVLAKVVVSDGGDNREEDELHDG